MIPETCAAVFKILEAQLKREIDSNKRQNCREKRRHELSVKKRGQSRRRSSPEMKPGTIKSLVSPLWISAVLQEIASATEFEYEKLINSKISEILWGHTSNKRRQT
jgi:hypothetical protein